MPQMPQRNSIKPRLALLLATAAVLAIQAAALQAKPVQRAVQSEQPAQPERTERPEQPEQPEQAEQAILAPIHALFDGMAKRDAAAIQAPTLSGGLMVLMRDGKPTQMTFAEFASHIAKPSKTQIEERIDHPLVKIDNDLAVVWARFEFLSDGKVTHCGTDLFNLIKSDGKWIIATVADTSTDLCPARKP